VIFQVPIEDIIEEEIFLWRNARDWDDMVSGYWWVAVHPLQILPWKFWAGF